MPVTSGADRGRQSLSRGIDCLPDVLAVDATGDLTDQDRSDPVGSELLMRAQEVDLSHLYELSLAAHLHGDARDKAVKSVFGATTNSDQPISVLTGREQRPP